MQLKEPNGEFPPAALIDYSKLLTFHGTLETHFFHVPQTKKTCAPHKIATASNLCCPATRARSPERLATNEGDPGGGR